MTRQAKQVGFVALNVRLPPDLHKRLAEAAANTRSLNAEILDRLQKSFEVEKQERSWLKKYQTWRTDFIAREQQATEDALEQLALRRKMRGDKEIRRLAKRIDELEARMPEEPVKGRRKKLESPDE